jgi:hypothetical protein
MIIGFFLNSQELDRISIFFCVWISDKDGIKPVNLFGTFWLNYLKRREETRVDFFEITTARVQKLQISFTSHYSVSSQSIR